MFRFVLPVAILAIAGCAPWQTPDDAAPPPPSAEAYQPESGLGPWIEHPEPDQTLHDDTATIWIRAVTPEAIEGLVVYLNGTDVSARFGPWGARRIPGIHGSEREGPESLGDVRPRPGLNRIEVWRGSAQGEPLARVDFRFEPHPLRVRVQVLEGDAGVPARVFFHGLDGTADPVLAPGVWSRIALEASEHQRNFLYTDGAPVEVHLPEGRYELLASRGPAYSLARARVDAAESASQDLSLRIERVVDTRGWISADFHVHAIPSPDSSLPLPDRIAGYLASDVDAIVASDHWTISDYRADLGPDYPWPADFRAIPGLELGTFINRQLRPGAPHLPQGHWNAWPLARDLESGERTSMGEPSYGGRRPKAIQSVSHLYAHLQTLNAAARRERYGEFPVVIQLNHPRGIQKQPFGPAVDVHDYLNSIGFDPSQPLDAAANAALLERPETELSRPIDVDAIELLNRLAYDLYLEVRADWFAWIDGGFAVTGTANSDSHWLVVTEAGTPRNWVRYDGPRPVEVAPLARAVRARQVVGSTGPLIEVEPWSDDGTPLRSAPATLRVSVRAPAWMPVAEVRLYVDGRLAATRRLPPAPADPFAAVGQLHRVEFPLSLDRDAFVVVEAGDDLDRLQSPQPHPPPLGRAFPNLRVLAFTNPLLIDVEGDGTRWDAQQARGP